MELMLGACFFALGMVVAGMAIFSSLISKYNFNHIFYRFIYYILFSVVVGLVSFLTYFTVIIKEKLMFGLWIIGFVFLVKFFRFFYKTGNNWKKVKTETLIQDEELQRKLDRQISIKYFFITLYSLPVIFFLIVVYAEYISSVDFSRNFHLTFLSIPFLILIAVEFVLWTIIKISQKLQLSKKHFFLLFQYYCFCLS